MRYGIYTLEGGKQEHGGGIRFGARRQRGCCYNDIMERLQISSVVSTQSSVANANESRNLPTSKPVPPFPMTDFRPFMNAPVAPSSCSMLLCQSGLPVHNMTCSEYAAMVLRSGVLRSMSKSGGVDAHSHVGEGHDCVYGITVRRSCDEMQNFCDETGFIRKPEVRDRRIAALDIVTLVLLQNSSRIDHKR